MPECGDFNAPIIYTIPLQILAYEVACLRGTDLDQPRNLAKSVNSDLYEKYFINNFSLLCKRQITIQRVKKSITSMRWI